MKIEPFKPEHLERLEAQTGRYYPQISPENRITLGQIGLSFTCLKDDRVLACGGVVQYWENRAEGWCIFDQNLKFEMMGVHRAALRLLETAPFKRIEAVVNSQFYQGNRWAKALGFQVEALRLKNYFADGADANLYSRIR